MKNDFWISWLPDPFDTWVIQNLLGFMTLGGGFILSFLTPNGDAAWQFSGYFGGAILTFAFLYNVSENFFHIRRLLVVILSYLPFAFAIYYCVILT